MVFFSHFLTPSSNGSQTLRNDEVDERVIDSVYDRDSLEENKVPLNDEKVNPKILSEEVPENATNIKEIDSMIAKQMMTLSVEDREKIYMDVHGVKEGAEETVEALQAGLESMHQEIEKLHDKEAYDLARKMDPDYVENRNFRLAFLRADSYDARKAAIRIVRHFQAKLDLFGKEKLALDIVQDDLDGESIEALYDGREQLLDIKDSAGRAVGLSTFGIPYSSKATLQRAFYNAMYFTRNPDVQIHGFVVVGYTLNGKISHVNVETVWSSGKILEALPMRFEAVHLCHDSLVLQMLFAIAKTAASPFTRLRTRTHYGTHNEIMSSLASYGIALGTIPVAEGCKITNHKAHHQRLTELRSAERMNQPRRQKVYVPSKFDVLFGKGTPFQTHPGNVNLRAVVAERYKMYEKAKKGHKKQIVDDIVKTVQEDSGMFLKPDGDSWICVDDDAARKKFLSPSSNGSQTLANDDADARVIDSVNDRDSLEGKVPMNDEKVNPKILSEQVPENATNIKEIDSMIANQMMKLSVEDREKIYMDVHGVKEGAEETVEALQAGLESMHQEIEKLHDKEAYDLARKMDPDYVENRNFRLAFLRADSYDARKAAIRIVRHFQVKLDLFGKEKLALDIVQDDLDGESMEALYSGREQLLDTKDSAGRAVGLSVFGAPFSSKATLQRGFYNSMFSIRNPDVQIHGMVVVGYTLNAKTSHVNVETMWKLSKILEGLPLRHEAIHLCHDSLVLQMLFAITKTALSPFARMRTRTHYGTHNEIMSSLASFGIALGTIPVAQGCKITNHKAHHQRLNEWRSAERLNQPRRQKVYVPSKFDVLFGKGTPFQAHPGNIKLRAMVAERYKMYEKAKKGHKKQIADEIVKSVQEDSGMFLKPDGDSWICVDDDAARTKVSASFRTLRLKLGDR